MDIIKNIASKIGGASKSVWSFMSGKKRWISLGLLAASHFTPAGTVVGKALEFLNSSGYDYVTTALQVLSGLFATSAAAEHIVKKVKE